MKIRSSFSENYLFNQKVLLNYGVNLFSIVSSNIVNQRGHVRKKGIELEKIIKKFFGGKSQSSSLMNKLASGLMAPASIAYICPECNLIIGIAQ